MKTFFTTKNIFFILFGVWTADTISTILALNLGTNVIESNILLRYFFNMGFLGWMLIIVLIGFFLLAISFGLSKLNNATKSLGKGHWSIVFIFILVFIALEIYAIIHNLSYII